jgi:hypothetical protein
MPGGADLPATCRRGEDGGRWWLVGDRRGVRRPLVGAVGIELDPDLI